MADFIRRAKPSAPREHRCPGGCARLVPVHLLACDTCWAALPQALRRALGRALRAGRGSPPHRAARAAAYRWYDENLPGAL